MDQSGDAPTVQAGIDSAAEGDTVLVGPGTYFENIEFRGIDVILKSMMGPEATTLDGSLLDSAVVAIRRGESRGTIVEGFRITGGSGGLSVVGDIDLGGGIHIFEAEPIIRGNIVEGNTAIGRFGNGAGGGIYCASPSPNASPRIHPLFEGNLIRGNRAGTNGGGIAIGGNVAPEIVDNIIIENEAAAGDGGGIWFIFSTNEGLIQSNRIENNRARDHGGGILGAFSFGATRIEISANIILGNVAQGRPGLGDSGGGIWLCCSSGLIQNNTIVGNLGSGDEPDWGGGIALSEPGSPVIERNIIALSPDGGGISCIRGVTPVIRNNLAWGNVPVDGAGICADWFTRDGNIVADPLFCDASAGDLSVPTDSPAFTHPTGILGAILLPGCKMGTPILSTTWSSIKVRFRN